MIRPGISGFGRKRNVKPSHVVQWCGCAIGSSLSQWLRTHPDQIEVFWLPAYCPSLNLIERLWGHLKRTVLANVLFSSIDDLVAAFRRGVACVNGHRKKMGFMFDHDDVNKKAA